MSKNYRCDIKDSWGWRVMLFHLSGDKIGDGHNQYYEDIIEKIEKIIKSNLEEKFGIELYRVDFVQDERDGRLWHLETQIVKDDDNTLIQWEELLWATNNGFGDGTIAYHPMTYYPMK